MVMNNLCRKSSKI